MAQYKITFYVDADNETIKNLQFIGAELITESIKVKSISNFNVEPLVSLKQKIFLGTINLGTKTQVTDPGYEPDDSGTVTLSTLPGKYETFMLMKNYGTLGNRVLNLQIRHKDYINKELAFSSVSYIDVDGASAGFFDYKKFVEVKNKDKELENEPDIGPFRSICWDLLSGGKYGGIIPDYGVISKTGWGDGSYELQVAYNENLQVIAAKIIFIE